jgi:hypothetical protein
MKLKANSGGGQTRQPIPQGTYRAAIVEFIHLGTSEGGMYGPKNQAMVTFQPFDEDDDRPLLGSDGEPVTISKFYTVSFNSKSSLRQDVESMIGQSYNDGDDFDIRDLLGMQGRVRIVHEEKLKDGQKYVKDKIAKVESCSKRDRIDIDVIHKLPVQLFEITGTHCEIPAWVNDWARKQIQASPEWSGTTTPSSAPARTTDFNEFADELTSRVAGS